MPLLELNYAETVKSSKPCWGKLKGFFSLERLLEETLAFARQKYHARLLILLKALEKAEESRTTTTFSACEIDQVLNRKAFPQFSTA